MSLKKQAISGIIWTYIQQFSIQLIGFVVSIVLARLLLPEDYGLIGMLTVFIAIGGLLTNGGLTSSLIRSAETNSEDYSTVFFFNLAGSIVFYGILFLCAPLIAAFYKHPELARLTRVYGLSFVLTAFGAVQSTLLTKEMKFKKLLFINLPALLISSIVGLIFAYKGAGVWSLVWMYLSNAFFTSLFLWVRSEWSPSWRFNRQKFKLHFNYGYKMTLSGLLELFFTNIYQIVIGRYYTSGAVGYYTRANSLMLLPVGNISNALNTVVFPLLSKVQNDPERLKIAYKQVMLMVLFLVTPMVVLMIVLAKPLIVFLFTEKWLPMLPVFQVICLTGILYPIHSYNLIVLQVKGRSDLFLRVEVLKKVLAAVILVVSFSKGFYGLLWGQVIFSVLALFINTYYAGKMINYPMIRQMIDILPVFFFSLIAGGAAYGLVYVLKLQSDILCLLAGGGSGALVYILVSILFKYQSVNDLKNLLKFRK